MLGYCICHIRSPHRHRCCPNVFVLRYFRKSQNEKQYWIDRQVSEYNHCKTNSGKVKVLTGGKAHDSKNFFD